ncbi:MAG TPA: hypothetical protein VJ001_14005 [Rhodocyclaceae bacterium]|nr:hypothetical protein [Rhodocyclaceae bacterium]
MIEKLRAVESRLIAVVAILAVLGLSGWHWTVRKAIEERYIQSQLVHVKDKRAELESVLGTVYQNIRTITLLPSVKAIKGGNRIDEKEDVVKSGRFSEEGWATVQQIYNNLATQVSVSEIYAVIDGLDAKSGQIPFFMFDTLMFGDQAPNDATDSASKSTTPDSPEESEAAEYAYFPQQIEAIKAAYPRFSFAKLDDIPAFVSPLMRTCDNAQYLSVSHGSEKEASGVLFSAPFYDNAGGLRGVISAILRANLFESLLLGVPFIPVTDEDRAQQRKANWQLPEPARFVLGNEKYAIEIFDRRFPDLPEKIAKGKPGRNVFHMKLNVHSDAPWDLAYYLPDEAIDADR